MEQRTRRRFLRVGAVGTVAALAGCASDSSSQDETTEDDETSSPSTAATPTATQTATTTPTATPDEQYPDAYYFDEESGIVLRDVDAEAGQFSISVTGEATNESDRDYDYVQLTFGLYDESDAKVGDAYANTSGLPAGQRWRFDATGTGDTAATFQITDVTAY